ncbi:MAG TPA: division/cell wall cluster transcriptional repressor MraZ [Thiobacillaceae bacterium]|nr:division/cell wall cluster transcriptional repressor MraZ [Thiobacillaceae bacterium]HNU63705.1 division/cell wall cluster transcriptional repressor MraZ [Thiobacillaceae bacterium]
MFRGSTQLALDGKGRLSIPAKYRERLMARCGGHLMLTANPIDGCLLLYPYPEWEVVEARINGLNSLDPVTRQLKMLVVGSAEELELDSAGRILVPPMLRKYAKLGKDVVLVGQDKKFALWSDTAWQALYEQATHLPEMLNESLRNGTLPEELKGFSL